MSTYNYNKYREYQKRYQRESPAAKAARKKYYQKYYEQNKAKRKEYNAKCRSTKEGQLKAALLNAKRRAAKKGLDFTLDIEFMLTTCPDVCPVFHTPLLFGGKLNSPHAPSLDRIDNTKGYTKENTRIISMRANRIKSDATEDEIQKILLYMQNKT